MYGASVLSVMVYVSMRYIRMLQL